VNGGESEERCAFSEKKRDHSLRKTHHEALQQQNRGSIQEGMQKVERGTQKRKSWSSQQGNDPREGGTRKTGMAVDNPRVTKTLKKRSHTGIWG